MISADELQKQMGEDYKKLEKGTKLEDSITRLEICWYDSDSDGENASLIAKLKLWLDYHPQITHLRIMTFSEKPILCALCRMLGTNTTITDLEFRDNTSTLTYQRYVLAAEDVAAVFNCLLVNRTIQNLIFYWIEMNNPNCKLLRQVLAKNNSLKSLNCGRGAINLEGACEIYRGLAVNRGLEVFSMKEIEIQDIFSIEQEEAGAIVIAHLLANNDSLRILHLCQEGEGFEFRAFVIIMRALRHNKTLTELSGWGKIRNYTHYYDLFRDELRDIISNHPSIKSLGGLENRGAEVELLRWRDGFQMREQLGRLREALGRQAAINEMHNYTSLIPDCLNIIASYSCDPCDLQPYTVKPCPKSDYTIRPQDIALCSSLFPMKYKELKKEFAEQQAYQERSANLRLT